MPIVQFIHDPDRRDTLARVAGLALIVVGALAFLGAFALSTWNLSRLASGAQVVAISGLPGSLGGLVALVAGTRLWARSWSLLPRWSLRFEPHGGTVQFGTEAPVPFAWDQIEVSRLDGTSATFRVGGRSFDVREARHVSGDLQALLAVLTLVKERSALRSG